MVRFPETLQFERWTSWRSHPRFIGLGVCLAAFTETFLYGIIIPLLPFTLKRRIDVPEEDVQKWIAILLPMYSVGSILGSFLTPLLSRKMSSMQVPYTVGLVSLALSTALFAFSRNLPLLLIGRAFQGLSSAAVWTAGLVILNSVTDKSDSGKAMGFVNACAAVGYMTGPAVGGIVYESLGYYAVYGIASGLVAVDIVFRLMMKTDTLEDEETPVLGTSDALIASKDVAPLSLGQDCTSDSSSRSSRTPEVSETSALLGPATSGAQSEKTQKALPLSTLLKSWRLLAVLVASLAEHTIFTTVETLLPQHLATSLHWSASQISILFLIMVAPTLLSPFVGRLWSAFGARAVTTAGLAVCAPCLVGLRVVGARGVSHQASVAWSFTLITGVGIGLGLVMTPILAEISNIILEVCEESEIAKELPLTDRKTLEKRYDIKAAEGIAFGSINVTMMGAGIIGPLFGGLIVETRGWSAATLSLGVYCALCAVFTSIFLKGRSRAKEVEGLEESC